MGPNRNFNLAIGRAKLRGSAKVAFSVANSEIRWAELVPSRTVLTLSVQNGPACSKSALEKLGPIWSLGSIWLFSFYNVLGNRRESTIINCQIPIAFRRIQRINANDENKSASLFVPFFCSRPNLLDLLAQKRLLRLPLSVGSFFSSLEQILIKAKRL